MNTENNTTNIPVTGPQATPKSSALDKKARDIIGLPVVTFNRGSKIADVEDMILDPARPQVLALVLENSSFMRSARIVPFGYISSIGRDAVIVPDGKAVVDLNRTKDKTLP